MQRGSDKHGPRMDDQQKHETEGMVRGGGSTHAEEWKEPEAMRSADEESTQSYPPGHEPGVPQGMTQQDVDVRSELARWLSDTHWPTSKEELLRRAQRQGAPDRVLDMVEALPDRSFENMADIAQSLGIGVEQGRW
ncbi:hypothetical protein C1J01_36470 [Nonomuraea aridisoli]|uniref:DUF2795 domain-containing protein n=2 Tax=Nonomuraea aridisoli TaxID=2070368 RepID=A0A2W2DEF3_9ACTN|nr:hypothetical protein C1J01_36470 [Nonomuraea aridisoli]